MRRQAFIYGVMLTTIGGLSAFGAESPGADAARRVQRHLAEREAALLRVEAHLSQRLGDVTRQQTAEERRIGVLRDVVMDVGTDRSARLRAGRWAIEALRQRQDYDRAIEVCQELVQGFPDDRSLTLLQAETLLEKAERLGLAGRYAEAIPLYEWILSRAPELPPHWSALAEWGLGKLHRLNGNPKTARIWYGRILREHPGEQPWYDWAKIKLQRLSVNP